MKDCIFCRIVRNEEPSRRVYEDAHTLAFLDRYPVSPGHCLVVPKRHIVWYTDLEPAEAGPFSKAVYVVAQKIKRVLKPEYVSILIRGTRVPHLHALLIPKLPGQDNIFDKTLDLHHYFQARQLVLLSEVELDRLAGALLTQEVNAGR